MNTAYTENVEIQMRKGMLEFCVLSMLSHQACYASEILEALKKEHLLVVDGTLYPLLNRMHRDGLLLYEWQESALGPPRKYYQSTKKGKEIVKLLLETWKQLSCSIDHIISVYA